MEEDFSEYNADGTILRKAQLRMVEILQVVDKICKKNNIQYWLDYGTLLGAIRHKGIIPWDDDIDITLMRKDYIKLCKVLKKELPEDLIFQDESTDKNYFCKFAKVRDKNSMLHDPLWTKVKEKGIYIDIFPVEKMVSKRMKKFVDYFYFNAFTRSRGFYKSKMKYMSGWVLLPFAYSLVVIARAIAAIYPSKLIFASFGVPFYYEAIYHSEYIFPCKPVLFEGKEFMAPARMDDYLRNIYGDYMRIPPKEKRITHSIKIEIYE